MEIKFSTHCKILKIANQYRSFKSLYSQIMVAKGFLSGKVALKKLLQGIFQNTHGVYIPIYFYHPQ